MCAGFAPVGKHGRRIGLTVTGMTILLRVCFSVVYTSAGQLSISFTAPIPDTIERTAGRADDRLALFPEMSDDVFVARAPVVDDRFDFVGFTPAAKTMDEDERIVVLIIGHDFTSGSRKDMVEEGKTSNQYTIIQLDR